MGALELKNLVLSKISEINDEQFLSEINAVLDHRKSYIISLSEEQKISIKKSQAEYLQGNFIENDVLNEEMEKWLKE
jgi:hypothetical protein